MELVIVGSILGLGYYLNKDGLESNRFEGKNIQDFLKNHEQKINDKNIYNSKDTIQIRNQEQEIANKLYKESKNTTQTNVLIAGPPSAFIDQDKHSTENIKLPVEFKSEYTEIDKKQSSNENVNDISFNRTSDELSGGWNEITDNKKVSKLTGGIVENYHNNMGSVFWKWSHSKYKCRCYWYYCRYI